MYQWWVFVHLAGVFGFLAAHGVSMVVLFRLRAERDPKQVAQLLQASGSSTNAFYWSFAVLLVGGIVAGFLGHWWSQGWIWAAIIVLVVATVAMYAIARPYYRRVRVVATALADGSTAVGPDQFDQVLRSSRSTWVAAVGVVALGAILYFMLFKPTLGFGGVPETPAAGPSGTRTVQIVAKAIAFRERTVSVPASAPFAIVLVNQDGGVPHNVSIYRDASAHTALFKGGIVTGPRSVTYRVRPLPAGTYFFRCDVHPAQMTGTLRAG
jgi:plastocyanin